MRQWTSPPKQQPEVSLVSKPVKSSRKGRRRIVGMGILASVVLPVAAYASLQPIDLPINVPISWPSNTEKGIWTEEPPLGSEVPSWEDIFLPVPPILDASQDIYQTISTGNVRGTLNRIIGILGELGILNPADAAAQVGARADNIPGGSSSGDPFSNPQTPAEVYDLQRNVDVIRSEMTQNLSQVVFGSQGQKAIADKNRAIQAAQQVSQAAQQGVAQSYEASAKQAQQSGTAAQTVAAEAEKARAATASQDVLKAVAAQNQDLAKIGAGHSVQLSLLGQAASYQSAQLSAANSQLSALNGTSQDLKVLSAAQNYQMTQIDTAIDHSNHYQHLKDEVAMQAASQSSTMIYIPGLMPQKEGR